MRQHKSQKIVIHSCVLIKSESANILSTFPLVVEEVKSAAMVEFRKRKDRRM
jgi:hypothetical protein